MNSSIFKFRLIRRFVTETEKDAEKKAKLPETSKKAKKSKKKIDWKKPAIVVFIMTTVPAYYFKQQYQSDYNYRLLLRESFPQYTKYIDAIIPTNDPIQIFKTKTTLNEGTENFLSSIFYVIEKTKYNDKNITRKDIVDFMKNAGYVEYEIIYNEFLNNSFLQSNNNSNDNNKNSSFREKLTMEYFFDLIGQKEAADKIRQANKTYIQILEEREEEEKKNKNKNHKEMEENKINENSNVTVDEFLILCEKIITSKMLNEKEFVENIQKYAKTQIENKNEQNMINVCGYDIVRKIYNLPEYNYVEENIKMTNRILEHQNCDINELNKRNKRNKNKDNIIEDRNAELQYLHEELSMLLQRKKDIELDIKETGDSEYYAEDLKNLNEDIRKIKKEIWDKNNYTAKIAYSTLGVGVITGIVLYFCNRK